MMWRSLLFLTSLLFLSAKCIPQQDSIPMNSVAQIQEGIFLTHADFRHNTAILKNAIVSTINRDQLFFLAKVMDNDTVSFKSGNTLVKLPTRNIWGFFQNNTLYINFEGRFYRVPVFGAICYFPATVETYYNTGGFYDPYFGGGMGIGMGPSGKTQEIRDFLMDYYSGKIIPYSTDKVEELLQKNKALYDDFMKLKRRQRREQTYRYIRKFNEQQTLYFLK